MEQSKFYQIKNITEQEYTLVGCDGSVITRPIQDVDRLASAFTIQDAKDGDVLSQDGIPFIFKSWDNNCIAYCGITGFGLFKVVKDYFSWCNGINVTPATKEQRELLFQKMKEAGYEWNAEKKELKKIESKSTVWSEDDEAKFNSIIEVLGEDSLLVNFLKSLKDRVQPQPKQEWSEEDENMLKSLNKLLNEASCYSCTEGVDKILDWLKSIKPNHWKPSEEQMEALDKAKDSPANYYNIRLGLQSLYNDLLKL